MSAFEHVTALLSFVYALALTHLLARIGELIVVRERVRFSGLLAMGMVNAIVLVFVNWLSLWDLRAMTNWDLTSIVTQFLVAVAMYVMCALAGPKARDEGEINLEHFFWHQRPYFYATTVAVLVFSLLANIAFLKTPNTALLLKENVATLLIMIPVLAAWIWRNRVVQWAAGITFLLMLIAFSVLFSSTLS
jgi:hypothetical protein